VIGFVIDAPFQAFQAREQGQWLDVEDRVLFVRLWQIVVGDLRAKVMDVMETDIACEPLQERGQLIE